MAWGWVTFFFEEYTVNVVYLPYVLGNFRELVRPSQLQSGRFCGLCRTRNATRLPGKRNAAMGKRNATRVTAADIAKSGDLGSLIKKLVKQAAEGDNEAKESAAATLSSLAFRASHQHSNSGPARVAYAPLLTRPDWCLSPLVSSRRKS